jgi:hypothetical protein
MVKGYFATFFVILFNEFFAIAEKILGRKCLHRKIQRRKYIAAKVVTANVSPQMSRNRVA